MRIVVVITSSSAVRPALGTPISIELRDTSLADAPSVLIAKQVVPVAKAGGAELAVAELDVPSVPRGASIRVHIDVDGDGRVSKGDFVSTGSHPVAAQPVVQLEVPVRLV